MAQIFFVKFLLNSYDCQKRKCMKKHKGSERPVKSNNMYMLYSYIEHRVLDHSPVELDKRNNG